MGPPPLIIAMGTTTKPVIYKIDDNLQGLQAFQKELAAHSSEKEKMILLDYPTVYIHHWKSKDTYEVYIGESNHVFQRTKQHFDKSDDASNWQYQLKKNSANLYIIGHEHFNKSLTLDIENRLMLYMMSIDRVKKLHNKRGNPQNRYYPDEETNEIFRSIWNRLRRADSSLFPKESAIKDSAIFKASPLHRLTQEQENIKDAIVHKVFSALKKDEREQLIFIDGEAGTGKTVLNSSTFYELYLNAEEHKIDSLTCCLLVNHDEQITVYKQIAEKLGLGDVVCKPTVFINHHSIDEPVDVAFIDEAHLLLTQGKQSYQGSNQLADILKRARVTVVMFDENQILTTEQYWEAQILDHFRNAAKESGNYFQLTNQMRMAASPETIAWIDDFTKNKKVSKIPSDSTGYEVKIFECPADLETAIKKRASEEEHELSRIVATYDWEYRKNSSMKSRMLKYWEVLIGDWHKPWNRELDRDLDPKTRRKNKTLSWAEQPQTIDEIGSTFTIQGFDLNYAGVILGPSVKYRDGKIVFDSAASFNTKATRNRTLSDGTKKKFGETLIQHEVRVLMTRGVNGLYIYACDEELRKVLKDAMH
ncbi:MAG: DNA/RNA helicase domain-containing protein [Blautia sp.]|jgi:DUF2075 family protein